MTEPGDDYEAEALRAAEEAMQAAEETFTDAALAQVRDAAGRDEERRAAAVVAAIDRLAREGMSAATEAVIEEYLKRECLLTIRNFRRIVQEARRDQQQTVRESRLHPPADDAHLHTPPPLASNQDILARVVDVLRVCRGLVGENTTAQLLYLIFTSRLFRDPVNGAVKGLPASGKSYTAECVADLFPAEAIFRMTAMSERALIYLDAPLSNVTILLYEATALREGREKAEDNQTAYIVRSLISEGEIRYPVVTKDESGQLVTRVIVKEGPTNFVLTTTSTSLHNENETRMLSLASNDSAVQTRRVMLSAARGLKRAEADFSEWHHLQRWLAAGDRQVVIPFAACIAAQIPPVAVRLRRDFTTVLQLIRSHAVLHQANREEDAEGRVIASITDYTVVRRLVEPIIASGVGKTVPASVRQTVELVATADGLGMTVAQVATKLGIERSAAQRRLTTARQDGYIINLEDKRGKAARYSTRNASPLPGDEPVLPDPGEVCTGCAGVQEMCKHVAALRNPGSRRPEQ